jgi:hypothetical protein
MKNEILCFMKPMKRRLTASFIHSFIHEGSSFFLGFFPCSQCVPIMFPWASQVVPPKMFPIAPHIYPIWVFLPKVQLSCMQTKEVGTFVSILQLEVKRDASIWECPMLPKIWWWANQNDSFNPKKKSCEYTPMN